MKFTKIAFTTLFTALVLCGCNKSLNTIIMVNDTPITKAQYDKEMAKAKKDPGYKNMPPSEKRPNSLPMLMMKDRIVNNLISKTIIQQELDKRNFTVSVDEFAAKRADLIKRFGSEQRLLDVLTQHNVSDEQFKEDLNNEIKIDKLVDATNKIEVSDKEVTEFYNQNKARFELPERVKASHILIEADPQAIRRDILDGDKNAQLKPEEVDKKVDAQINKKLQQAQKIQKEAASNPKNFATLAKKYSQDVQSAKRGGELGFIDKQSMVKPFADAAFALKPNTVSGVVKSQFGYHIILVTDRAAAEKQSLAKVKKEIETFLKQDRRVEAFNRMFEGLRINAKIQYLDKSFDPANIRKQTAKQEAKMRKKMERKEKSKLKFKFKSRPGEAHRPIVDQIKEAKEGRPMQTRRAD